MATDLELQDNRRHSFVLSTGTDFYSMLEQQMFFSTCMQNKPINSITTNSNLRHDHQLARLSYSNAKAKQPPPASLHQATSGDVLAWAK